ncbi:hypothetical protein ACGFS9_08265 [Streptomyces sp. NPDC048566]|uniref:hypothetical protein n=1 Tax=Streptomyces sp. NPDC048566 TaxID=3365569 RepID=UPI003710AD4D
MTVGGWCRTARAGMFAAVCVLLAALGHVMMSGASVPGWTLAAGAAATGGAGWFLAGRERGTALVVTVVVVAQATLHETFALGQSMTAATASGRPVLPGSGTDPFAEPVPTGRTGAGLLDAGPMHMDPMGMGSMGGGSMGGGGMLHGTDGTAHLHGVLGGGGGSLGMPAAHLLAALACGIWLAHGERAVFRLLRTAAARLSAPLRMLLALPAPGDRPLHRRRRTPAHRTSLARFLLCYSVTSRGPPTGAAVR